MLMDSTGAICVRFGGMTSQVFFTLLAACLWHPSHSWCDLSTYWLILFQKNLSRKMFFMCYVTPLGLGFLLLLGSKCCY